MLWGLGALSPPWPHQETKALALPRLSGRAGCDGAIPGCSLGIVPPLSPPQLPAQLFLLLQPHGGMCQPRLTELCSRVGRWQRFLNHTPVEDVAVPVVGVEDGREVPGVGRGSEMNIRTPGKRVRGILGWESGNHRPFDVFICSSELLVRLHAD